MAEGDDRRGFLSRMGSAVFAAFALRLGGACADTPRTADGEDDRSMHGPVRTDSEALRFEEAPDAARLFAPFEDGRALEFGDPLVRRWAIARVARGPEGQLVVAVVDLETGGLAELEVFRHDPAIDPIAASRLYAFHLDNGGRGDVKTPRHLERIAAVLAEVVRAREGTVVLGEAVPTLREASALRFVPDVAQVQRKQPPSPL